MKPMTRSYKAGSIIYFSGDAGRDIYVLQQGKVSLVSLSLDGLNEISERVQKGEFFGVKSSLGNYPREETAKVLQDSLVLVFNPKSFETFSLKNTRIVLQMLKVFSSHLRKIHQKVRDLLGEAREGDTSNELLSVAEHYHKKNNYVYATYAYNSYLKNYNEGILIERANKLLLLAKAKKSYPRVISTIDQEIAKLLGKSTSNSFSQGEAKKESFAEENENSLEQDEVATLYYDGMNALSTEDYKTAIVSMQKILTLKTLKQEQETFFHKAHYDLPRIFMKMKKNKEALDGFSRFIRKFPRSDMLRKAMNSMAEIYVETNNIEKAKGFYLAVSKMKPEDKDSIAAMNKLKELEK